jgi:hypothetical protein
MATITIADVLVRTTNDNPGHVHGVSIGGGPDIDSAMISLMTDAQHRAEELARELQGTDREDAVWQFEVIDLRIIPGPPDREDERWLAYGTLASRGRTPWTASYWDEPDR